jgi:hypothetical protein
VIQDAHQVIVDVSGASGVFDFFHRLLLLLLMVFRLPYRPTLDVCCQDGTP